MRDARVFIAESLSGLQEDVVETAQLLTSELVTNAILHAGTEVEVRTWAAAGRVHIRVFDGQRRRPVVRRRTDAESGTGRGLKLVEALAAAYGVDVSGEGKAVWFELWPGVPRSAPGSTWFAPIDPTAGSDPDEQMHRIEMVGVPVGLARAAQRHRAALLREGRLASLTDPDAVGVEPGRLVAAGAVDNALDAAWTDALNKVDPADTQATIALDLATDSVEGVPELAGVLRALNNAARAGRLLTRPALPELAHFREWMIGEIMRQSRGEVASRYRSISDGDQSEGGDRPPDWDPSDVTARTVPAIAADDDNNIVAVNQAASELLGWRPSELVGRRVTTIVPPAYRDRHIAGFTNFLLTGESALPGLALRVPAQRRDGTIVEVELSIAVELSREGRTVFIGELQPTTRR